jgi:hypothetical protein
MSGPQTGQAAVVVRRYRAAEKPCMQAIELLLKKAGGSDAGKDDARKVKDACTAKEKYTRT